MNNLSDLLKELADKLKVGVDYLWQALLVQAKISIIENIILIVLLSIWIVAYIIFLVKGLRTDDKVKYSESFIDEHELWWLALLGGVLTFVAIILLCVMINDLFTAWLNPGYWALNEILSKIK